jgi:RNA polymerase sigma-70 factor (ECF subfamily)
VKVGLWNRATFPTLGVVATTDEAFERAYSQHLSAVGGFLYRRVERRFVEDLAADVFAIAWRRRASVTEGEELPWLYRIAANVVSNHRRKQATGLALLAALRPTDSAPSAEDIAIADASLSAAWRTLRSNEREILALALVEDLAIADVAIALGISPNAASIRLHRAKKKLADLLSSDVASEPQLGENSGPGERSGGAETSPTHEQSS